MEQENIHPPDNLLPIDISHYGNFLFKPIPVAKQLIKPYKKLLGGTRIVDLLYHFPTRVEKREAAYTLNDIMLTLNKNPKSLISTVVTITNYERPKFKKKGFRIHGLIDDGTPIQILYFNGNLSWIQKLYPINQQKTITGTCSLTHGLPIFTHPDQVAPKSAFRHYVGSFPVYPLSAGISLNTLTYLIRKILKEEVSHLPEWIRPDVLEKNQWPSWKEALLSVHYPNSNTDLDPNSSKAYQRIIYDECLARQLDIHCIKQKNKSTFGTKTAHKKNLFHKLQDILPFELTFSQKSAIEEIYKNMHQSLPMRRLLQGDVGSGKTIVALSAALFAIESGFQVAILAPTEILARQHMAKLKPLALKLGITIDLLLGGYKQKKSGKLLYENIKNGKIQLIIGTHSLIEESVVFKKLGLTIVDEQHRFGVDQRLKLVEKGKNIDMLSMTATPIPRSLQMTIFSDMDTTLIKEKPQGRQEIQTSLLDHSRLGEVVERLRLHIQKKGQVYWVCPLIEESEKLTLTAAENRYQELAKLFPNDIALIHGKLKSTDREKIMEDFASGKISILIATTVIEVGVDVPNANLIIIEHAERFGLAQLHQLRGRVGRSQEKSYCLLIYAHPLSETAKSRLSSMKETNDGFLLAERDLKLRGGGDIYGTLQSGYSIFKIAEINRDLRLFYMAKDEIEENSYNFENLPATLKFLRKLFKNSKNEDYTKAG